jgi:hypothetical protein
MTDNPNSDHRWSPFDGTSDRLGRAPGPTAGRGTLVVPSSDVTQDTEGK